MDLHSLEDAIGQSEEPTWWPSLTFALVNAHPSSSATYATASENDLSVADPSIFTEISSHEGGELQLRVEFLGRQQAMAFFARGLELYEFDDVRESSCLQTLSEAMRLVAQVPSLGRTIQALVRSIHLLRPNEPTIDTSFSEPRLPFSIFVSVPPRRIEGGPSRLAESIVHESMHLQLSLAELQLPMIGSTKIEIFSPWRGEIRSASGLLHALYVFRVVFDWLGLMRGQLPLYATRRRQEIEQQIHEVDWQCLTPALTACGKTLVHRLLQGLAVGT